MDLISEHDDMMPSEDLILHFKMIAVGADTFAAAHRRFKQQLPSFKNIVSIKGIGPRSAALLLSVIGNINNFASEKKLQSYFGIVRRVRQSNQTLRTGRITKEGSKLGRTTLVQCTLVAIRYSPYLNSFYQRLKMKKGSGKAIIATAKKLLGIIYLTLKNDWIFEDFPNFVTAK